MATIDLSGNRGNGQTLFDPSGSRLYYAAGDPTATSDGPWPLTIVAYDLNTGQESTRLSLPSILIGTMYNGVIDQVPVANVMAPAIALSPDGSRIAVVHADSEQLTLIDAQHMTVIKTVPVVHPKSILNRLFSWVAPQTAEAKYMTGSSRSAVFSADGRALYVYGSEATITEGNREVERGLGLELVDANSGEIKAASLDGVLIDQVLPGPGGQNLYLSGPDESWYTAQGEPSYTVRRLDAATLDTHAQRTFPDVRRILLAPTVTS
ncbi:MAG TPA: hypothetical protein VFL82_13430 [Thermomicrobiales bacterium]|nr:hypothetical protein [Thermomicrobiales bacterium]